MHRWNCSNPIYQQLADRVMAGLLDRNEEGAALPSIRELSRTYAVNPLTVTRALERLREQGWIETRLGVGLSVGAGARTRIVDHCRQQFLEEEWPALRQKLARLNISASDLR